ncbi:hypothetical protein AHAS_Ahas19G0120200 [Arachis hypogaea]
MSNVTKHVLGDGARENYPVSTSDSETLPGSGGSNANNQWRDFFKLLKKGSQMPFQPFHPLKKNVPKLTRRKSKRVRDDLIPSYSNYYVNWGIQSCIKTGTCNTTTTTESVPLASRTSDRSLLWPLLSSFLNSISTAAITMPNTTIRTRINAEQRILLRM